MPSNVPIQIVECHAEGEVGDVIVAGIEPPPGETLWEQSRGIANDDKLRQFVLNEPRGGVFRHCNLLVPPKHPDADVGFIIMEPVDTPPMSGTNSMCVATVVLQTGLVTMKEPITSLKLEAPGGLVTVEAQCSSGRVESVTVRNVPSFAYELNENLAVDGIGPINVDIAYGDELRTQHAVAIRPGKIDRSPTGTGVSARLAVLGARGQADEKTRLVATSIIGSRFVGRIMSRTTIGELPAIIPSVEGRAWVSGTRQLVLDPHDPWPLGYRVADTWPGAE